MCKCEAAVSTRGFCHGDHPCISGSSPGPLHEALPILGAVRVHAHERMCRHAVHIQPGRRCLCVQDTALVLTSLSWLSQVLSISMTLQWLGHRVLVAGQ